MGGSETPRVTLTPKPDADREKIESLQKDHLDTRTKIFTTPEGEERDNLLQEYHRLTDEIISEKYTKTEE